MTRVTQSPRLALRQSRVSLGLVPREEEGGRDDGPASEKSRGHVSACVAGYETRLPRRDPRPAARVIANGERVDASGSEYL